MPKPAKPKPPAKAKPATKSPSKSAKPKALSKTKSSAKTPIVPAPSAQIDVAVTEPVAVQSEQSPEFVTSTTAGLNLHRAIPWGMVALVSVVGLIWQTLLIKPPTTGYSGPQAIPKSAVVMRRQLQELTAQTRVLSRQENTKDVKVVDQATIDAELAIITTDLNAQQWNDAKTDLARLKHDLTGWQAKLKQALGTLTISTSLNVTQPPDSVFIPILLYHQTPSDFEQQLAYLQNHKYTTITMSQVAATLTRGAKLPSKPVVISFDDGYSSQWSAFRLLKKFQMKAIFYIIIVRANSGCEPAITTCNPDYLSWEQILQLDHSGLITIGDHTVNHPDLTTLDRDHQQTEIMSARETLQLKLGHPVLDFAYPYGSFDSATLDLMARDGFRTAVTTQPGQYQLPDDIYGLHRIRQAYDLP